jgi:hypothetical protein
LPDFEVGQREDLNSYFENNLRQHSKVYSVEIHRGDGCLIDAQEILNRKAIAVPLVYTSC